MINYSEIILRSKFRILGEQIIFGVPEGNDHSEYLWRELSSSPDVKHEYCLKNATLL